MESVRKEIVQQWSPSQQRQSQTYIFAIVVDRGGQLKMPIFVVFTRENRNQVTKERKREKESDNL